MRGLDEIRLAPERGRYAGRLACPLSVRTGRTPLRNGSAGGSIASAVVRLN